MKQITNLELRILNVISIIILILCSSIFANDLIPGKKQEKPIALTNAKIFTISSAVIENGTLVFDEGKIIAIGDNTTAIPENADVIDLQGKHVYPGLIVGYSNLGLVEIGAVRATKDYDEVGPINPNARADVAYNPDSDVTPTVRSNGITTALIAPSGGLISGTGSVISLDGWNIEDSMVKKDAGIILNWPAMTISAANWQKDSGKEQQQKIDKKILELENFIEDAKVYTQARKSKLQVNIDIRLESMMDVIEGKTPVIIQANEYKQIETAVDFCKRHKLKMILLGGEDSWKLAGLLKENNIPVLLRSTHRLPAREDEDYDIAFKRPHLLQQAGIKFSQVLISNWVWDVRNLPFYAGTAVAHGLSKEDALKSITLWPAEIFGIDKNLGSLEIGKSATLIVSRGDVLDMQSSVIEMMFIDGRKVDLDNKQKRLYRKYKARYED